MPPAKIRSAFTRSLKYGNGRLEAFRRRVVLLGREPVDQHTFPRRALAVERIGLGAGGRHGRDGVCALPLISASGPAPAEPVDQTDASPSRGLDAAFGPLHIEPSVLVS